MLVLGITWTWSVINICLWGYAACRILAKWKLYRVRTLFAVPIAGICVLTGYAEWFSLFGGVGLAANVGLLVADLIILIVYGKDGYQRVWKSASHRQWLLRLLLAGFLFLLLYPAARGIVRHYDTYLYHAQAIHWIEEYGVIKGLGNLHNRFAYNSSFFCLQALFSLKFLFHHSIHLMNAVGVWLLLCYVFGTWKCFTKKQFYPSDAFRIAIIYTLLRRVNLYYLSSPGTDILVQGLVGYFITEWVSRMEEREQDPGAYASLCVLGVFSMSLKLSAALVILLTIKPLMRLIKERRTSEIISWLGLGVFVITPFLIRNVMISGYLIYPYPELDLFPVDWKMNAFMAMKDRVEIRSWAQGLNDWKRFAAPITEWFPVWWKKSTKDIIVMILLICNPVFLLLSPVQILRDLKSDRDETDRSYGKDVLFLYSVIVINLLFFIIAAPDVRFGCIYLTLLPALVTGVFLSRCIRELEQRGKREGRFPINVSVWIPRVVLIISVILVLQSDQRNGVSYGRGYAYYNPDIGGKEVSWEGITIYVPETGDQISYECFPSTPYNDLLNVIELRGETLRNGFRLRREYRDALVLNNGKIWPENPFAD